MYWWTPADLSKEVPETDIEKIPSSSGASSTATGTTHHEDVPEPSIRICADGILVPESIPLSREETAVLEVIRNRFRETTSSAPNLT